MSSGLAALLDDVATIAKAAAASVDDVSAAASRASVKATGVVIDDTAVTPGYALGFSPERELPIIKKIAIGSLRNKFLILVPGALAISAFAPWALTPLLMLGGTYLCFEAAEKLWRNLSGHHDGEVPAEKLALASDEREAEMVGSAVRTDLILSAEITAIALADMAGRPLTTQAGALAVVSLLMTVGVYGAVALIVKMDDIGLHLTRRRAASAQAVGRGLVRAMPVVLSALASIGTAAMLWVGGGILVHGLHEFHLDPIPNAVAELGEWAGSVSFIGPVTRWLATAGASAIVGLVVGVIIVAVLHLRPRRSSNKGVGAH
jgi:predicted DNA repair protein MutK